LKKALGTTISLLFSFILLYGFYLILSKIFLSINELNPNVVASIIAALTAVFGFLYNQHQTKIREIKETHRAKKVELYNEFMEMMFEFLDQEKQGKFKNIPDGKLPRDVEIKFMKFHRGLITWGSSVVIQKYIAFRNFTTKPNSSHLLRLVNDLLLAIRKDLGNSNLMLKKGDLLKIFINDSNEIDKLFK